MQVPLLAGVIVDGLNGKGLRLFGFEWRDMAPHDVVRIAGLGLLVVAVVYGLSAYAYTVAGARLDRGFVCDVRKAVVEKIMLLSLDYHQRLGTGPLLDRALRDTDRLRGFTEQVFTRTATNAVRTVYPIVMLFVIHPVLALMAIAIVPPQWLTIWYLQKRLHKATRQTLASQSDLTAAMQENLDGIETVKALNVEPSAVSRLHDYANQVETDELATSRLTAQVRGAIWSFTSVGVALIWWYGGARVLAGEITIGALVAFAGFAELAYRPFRRFSEIVKTYRAGLASLERIQEVLEIESSVRIRPDSRPIQVRTGHITFRDVSFAYGSKQVLNQVNLDIDAMKLTAIVGSSGAGKSSFLRLIARLYDPDQGQLLIDDQPLEDTTPDSLRSRVAIVPQRPVLFSGTIFDNICLARPSASPREVRAACADASALVFIERLDNGFETKLGRHGVSLSAGEVQRLSIARALLTQPKILLMDEPTSALDAVSEAVVVNTLLALRGKMTVIVVTHRLETARRADRVIVLEGGRVVADGTHEDLAAESQVYRDLFGAGSNVNVGAA
jgi:ABC-type multidrug transport system fused ATPase/permease subunit